MDESSLKVQPEIDQLSPPRLGAAVNTLHDVTKARWGLVILLRVFDVVSIGARCTQRQTGADGIIPKTTNGTDWKLFVCKIIYAETLKQQYSFVMHEEFYQFLIATPYVMKGGGSMRRSLPLFHAVIAASARMILD